jgi:hypothetical protein
MNFFKKLFSKSSKELASIQKQEVALSLDDLFVHNFLEKGGKFLYCLKKNEVYANLKKIISENNWKEFYLLDDTLAPFLKNGDVNVSQKLKEGTPIFTFCEHLIADNGSILFSSNQLKSSKLAEMTDDFIVLATTSQLVKDTGEGLTGIKTKNKKNLPTNISAIKNYNIQKSDDNFLNYGHTNSKNLYLLLLEDL